MRPAGVAVVTGGAGHIGLAIVRRLAEEGMAVIAVDSNAKACISASQSLPYRPEHVRFLVADIGIRKGARFGIETAMHAFGRVDVLCNNAAIHPSETIEKHSIERWRETFRVNVDGTLLCTQFALPHMQRQRSGSIINMGSVSALVPYAGGGAYAASKAAIAAITKVTALEAGPFGVRVNCICPGAIVPPHLLSDATAHATQIPIGRFGNTDDVVQLVSYLASDASSYMTGSVLVLDGGATAGRARSH